MPHLWFIRYHIVKCFNIVPLNLDFNTLGKIWCFDLWMLVSIAPWSKTNPNYLWCDLCFPLAIVLVVHCSSSWPWVTNAFWVTRSELLPSMVSASVFLLFFGVLLWFPNTKYKSGVTYTTETDSRMTTQTHQFFIIDVYLIY